MDNNKNCQKQYTSEHKSAPSIRKMEIFIFFMKWQSLQ